MNMPVFDLMKNKKNEPGRTLEEVPVAFIMPNPTQPRKTFDDETIDELANSIRQVGLIQPLVVRKNGPVYELISGERRLRAVRRLKMEKVLCIVDRQTKDADSALMAVIENLQREDLNFFEEAECYRTLIEELALTQDELAERLGKSQSYIANKLRLLKLTGEERRTVRRFALSERHARAVLKLGSEEERLKILQKAGEEKLSVHDTERLVEKTLDERFDKKHPGVRPRPMIVRLVKDYRVFINTVNLACEQLRSGGCGVTVDQKDTSDGVEITIRVAKPGARAKSE